MKRIRSCNGCYLCIALGPLALIAISAVVAVRAQSPILLEYETESFLESASVRTAETVIRSWPPSSRAVASAMIARYGKPLRFGESALTWYNNGPWQRTVVHRNSWPHGLGDQDRNFLEQAVSYNVPNDKSDDLKRFDPRIEADAVAMELSSRSESEDLNFLALNLAHEIITERRGVEDARHFHLNTARLSMAGKGTSYLEGLLFDARPQNERINHPGDHNAKNPDGGSVENDGQD